MPEAVSADANGEAAAPASGSPIKPRKGGGKMVAARVKLLDNSDLELVVEVSNRVPAQQRWQ